MIHRTDTCIFLFNLIDWYAFGTGILMKVKKTTMKNMLPSNHWKLKLTLAWALTPIQESELMLSCSLCSCPSFWFRWEIFYFVYIAEPGYNIQERFYCWSLSVLCMFVVCMIFMILLGGRQECCLSYARTPLCLTPPLLLLPLLMYTAFVHLTVMYFEQYDVHGCMWSSALFPNEHLWQAFSAFWFCCARFFDKKRSAAKKEQKTMEASSKVSQQSCGLCVHFQMKAKLNRQKVKSCFILIQGGNYNRKWLLCMAIVH